MSPFVMLIVTELHTSIESALPISSDVTSRKMMLHVRYDLSGSISVVVTKFFI